MNFKVRFKKGDLVYYSTGYHQDEKFCIITKYLYSGMDNVRYYNCLVEDKNMVYCDIWLKKIQTEN